MNKNLYSDCKNCFGLCCVALPYGKSVDFPFDKDGGVACQNLCPNNLCTIHDSLREKGFRGCVSYECFGAGQHVSQSIYHGKDWRENDQHADEMFAVFPLVQQLHEMLWYLQQTLTLKETESFHDSLQKMFEETVELTEKNPKEILELDIAAHRIKVNTLLINSSKAYRADIVIKRKKNRIQKNSDYIGANLRGLNLQGEDLRGKLMIASDLRQSDLRKADLIGADLRDADLRGANLATVLFLTQSQINSAVGDAHTKVPSNLTKPSHW